MKKVIAVSAFAILGVVALSSCKKDYKCVYTSGGTEYTVDYEGLNKSAKTAAESQCSLLGGTFSAK